MATFKVGQRVKKIAHDPERMHRMLVPVGASGVILAASSWHPDAWVVDFPGCASTDPYWVNFHLMSFQIAPLTDPKADAFLESIRKMKPLHEEPKRATTYGELVDRIKREFLQ